MIGKLLSVLGGQGPVHISGFALRGLISPPLAHFGYSILPVSAFLSDARLFPDGRVGTVRGGGSVLSLVALVLAWVGAGAAPLAGLPALL